MRKKKKYYKVVSDICGRPASCLVCGRDAVHYGVGQFAVARPWAAARGYHPLIFGELEHAASFAISQGNVLNDTEIWECEIRGRPIKKTMPNSRHLTADCEVVWAKCLTYEWPLGTMMARAVKLTRPIPRRELERFYSGLI